MNIFQSPAVTNKLSLKEISTLSVFKNAIAFHSFKIVSTGLVEVEFASAF